MVIYYKCKNAENKELGTMEMYKSYIYQHEDEIVKNTHWCYFDLATPDVSSHLLQNAPKR